jgi:hypothetical protein
MVARPTEQSAPADADADADTGKEGLHRLMHRLQVIKAQCRGAVAQPEGTEARGQGPRSQSSEATQAL